MFTYWNSKASKEREAQIDRVNAQVQLCDGLRCSMTSELCARCCDMQKKSPL